ncbi:MAG: hypothetical protein HYZ17_15625 [Betaproteobacteria bacterium]|nr:hypothetical protein [Betaproteobacteria bacterium]
MDTLAPPWPELIRHARAGKLHRDRSAVKSDIDELARAGLLVVDELPLPGHERKKEVRAVAQQVVLSAVM